MSIFFDTFNFIKKHKKAIIVSSTVIAGSAASIYYYLSTKEKPLVEINEKWENEYNSRIETIEKKYEYLLSAYSATCQSRMKKYLPKIIQTLDNIYDIESIIGEIREAKTNEDRAKAFANLGKISIARDISFSIITCCMIFALECQANVIAFEMSHQSKLKITSESNDSEAYYTKTFLEMISLFVSENNLKNITNKINEIIFIDMESVNLKKLYTKDEFINTLTSLGKSILMDDFFQNISNKFVPNMNFVRQQQMELVVLFEDYVDLLDIICQNNLIESLVEKYLVMFGSLVYEKIGNEDCYYIGLIPKISDTYKEGTTISQNFDINDILKNIQQHCYYKLKKKN
uniref:Peroxisomal assembly protein PEX3 n=1 Tax=Strongyloides stercoralis TaxID=6248 RepID=A0A0K0E7N7_STRER